MAALTCRRGTRNSKDHVATSGAKIQVRAFPRISRHFAFTVVNNEARLADAGDLGELLDSVRHVVDYMADRRVVEATRGRLKIKRYIVHSA